jgi:gamma-glutamylcyclotransferase (GGCT)/AIG2-like uncharacterized protein YtfP
MALLFCYGSNNPEQLSQRLLRPVRGTAAFAPGYGRVFRGYSQKWGGGVASIEVDPDRITYGYVEKVTEDDLQRLDEFEGVASGFYRREMINVQVRQPDGSYKTKNAIAYINNKTNYKAPSAKYLRAITLTINSFWNQDGHEVTISDIPLRNPENYCRCNPLCETCFLDPCECEHKCKFCGKEKCDCCQMCGHGKIAHSLGFVTRLTRPICQCLCHGY